MHCYFTKTICAGVLKLIKDKNQFYIKLISCQCAWLFVETILNSLAAHVAGLLY